MIVEQTLNPQLQILDPVTQSALINIVVLILKDDVEIARTVQSTMTFQRDQIDLVKQFLGVNSSPEITYLETIWE